MNFLAAWLANDEDKDYKQAIYYRQQAIQHYPQLRFKSIYIRLSIAIIILALFGPQTYGKVRGLKKTLSKLKADTVS